MDFEKQRFIHPLTGILVLVASVVVMVIANSWANNYVFGFLIIAFAFLLGRVKFASAVFASFALLVFFIIAIRTLFLGDPDARVLARLGIFEINESGLRDGLYSSSLIFLIGVAVMFAFAMTRIKDLTVAFEKIGVSPKVSYIVLSTIEMIPTLRSETSRVMNAQSARGLQTEGNVIRRSKALLPAIGPVILSALVNTEERAITMETRGFSLPGKRIRAHVLHLHHHDYLIWFFLVLGTVLLSCWQVAA